MIETADFAELLGDKVGIAKAARLAGLMHDVGKCTPAFMARLEGAKERVDHSTAGASIVMGLAQGEDHFITELIAYCIAGHHAGLPDKRGTSPSTLKARLESFSEASLDPVWKRQINPDATGLFPNFHWQDDDSARFAFQIAFLGRMIFSCLVDADFKNTETFYARVGRYEIDRNWPALQTILPELVKAYDQHMTEKRRTDTAVNRLRTEILDRVREQAAREPGLFTLTVPTGGGKTLASLGFALDHAKAHGHERIIYAIPFTAIIDQTAAIFRDVLGDAIVLEHHSAVEDDKYDPNHPAAGKEKLKLAMEDWAAPVIVTTNVQLFESLFAARSARSRKLHNIAGSIIILDEAQTLPRPLLSPCTQALDELARNYGCTIVLCTATQPALDAGNFPEKQHPAGLALVGKELAPDPARLATQLERVRLVHGGDMDDRSLVAALTDTPQGLVIVNSRRHALALYRTAQKAGLAGLVHLTTRQYAEHRRAILDDVRKRLAEGQPCRVVATSLVEAGIDLDFPKAWRAEAGLDQIAQAAGRANREGKRPLEDSIVTIFRAPDNVPPPEIARLAGDMANVMRKHEKLLSPAAMEEFFGEVYWRVGAKGLDAKAILADFRLGGDTTDFAYRKVAENFRMIESGMVPVIVAREDNARSAVARLAIETIPSSAIARDLQTYIVQVPPRARTRLIACGHVRFEQNALRLDQFAVLMTPSLYQPDTGLLWEDAEYLATEDMFI